MPLSLGNTILLKEKGGIRESIPRQVDKKSRIPRGGERGLGLSSRDRGSPFFKEKERTNAFFFFPSRFLSLSHIKRFFSLTPELMITQQTTQFKLCPRDYITTVYPT